jgi:hypothetical protein
LGFDDFLISNFEGISVSSAVLMLAFAILRNSRADSKDRTDIDKAQIQLSQSILKDGADRTDAIKENTKALRDGQASISTLIGSLTLNLDAIGTASLKEHEETQSIATAIQQSVTSLVTEFAELKTIMNSALDSVKENASSVAALALRMSAMDNTLQSLVEKVYPNPASTQEIPEILQRTARAISEARIGAPEINPT